MKSFYRKKVSLRKANTKARRELPLPDEVGPHTFGFIQASRDGWVKLRTRKTEQSFEELYRKELERLHAAIEEDDLETVREIVESHADELHFSFDDTSALYKAFKCKTYEIISFLINKGAKFVGSEEKYVYSFGIDLDRVNHLLYDYNKKFEKSCIFRLISLSRSPQIFDGEKLNAIVSMYERFFRCEVLKSLMDVLENVEFEVVFDFASDKVNRVHRLREEEAEVFGLTLSKAKEIFIGAKSLLSGDPEKRAKVCGVVGEELCHLVLTTLFENGAKPYFQEDFESIQEFRGILLDVQKLVVRSSHIESVIGDVYAYPLHSWESELIARVPHVIAIYGEGSGRRIFHGCPELSRLLTFYEKNVLSKCRDYTDPSRNTKSDRIMKQLMDKNEYISFKEKRVGPLRKDFPSFRGHLVVEEGASVLPSKFIKLSALHVYHELKQVYGEQLERKCLFLAGECFEKKRDVILKALKCKLCDYLVLVLDDKELHHRRLLCEYLDHFKEFESEGINILIISNSQFLGLKFEEKAVEYQWSDLTDKYKDLCTWPVEYIFKGERKDVFLQKESVPELFSGEDIAKIMNGDVIEVQDGADLHFQGCNRETYVERLFRATIVDRNVFERLPKDTGILIYGLRGWELKELSIDESQVQWLNGSDDAIQKEKVIFIDNTKTPMKFRDFIGKTSFKNSICLKHNRKVFYLVRLMGDLCKELKGEIRQTEEEMIDLLKSNKTLIISENAGCGKSTVMSSLIRHVRKNTYNSWVFRVDLNKFWIKDECPDSDMFENVFIMLGFQSGFQKRRFRETRNQEDCFIFLDAFDEIPSQYKTAALKLVSFLRKNTDVRMMVATRTHHRQELEETLNAFSHNLVPFDESSQVNCLGKLWKWKLKFPSGEERRSSLKDKRRISWKIESIVGELEKEKANSATRQLVLSLKEINLEESIDSIRTKIDRLEFNRFAKYVLGKTCLEKETLDFMGIPLHVFMTGIIHFDGNFNVQINSGMYNMYSKFVEQKILIYVEEKQGILHVGRAKKNAVEKEREDAYRIHIELANQLMDEGKIDSGMSEEDLELCASMGIAFIKDAEVDFLHHTFAEFFRAESIRLSLKKDVFVDVLFDNRYKVVRRFLSSSLEEKRFENLTQEFFEEFEFLFDVLREFGRESHQTFRCEGSDCEFNSHASSVAKVVKRLLESLESTVRPDLLERFVGTLETEVLSAGHCLRIGGCLTVKMFKILFVRNFKTHFRMIFGVVSYYSNPEEVVEVLSECISVQAAIECDRNGRKNGSDRKAECLLNLLKIKDSEMKDLLLWAVWNVRTAIFARILKFSEEIVGKEQFITGVVGSKEYKRATNEFIHFADLNSIVGLLKELYSVFGEEIENLFDIDLKFNMLWTSLYIEHESSNAFEVAINLLKEFFGIESLKEFLQRCDSKGDYLVHILVLKIGHFGKNLNVIKNVLDEDVKMKQFLMFKDRRSWNLLHMGAGMGNINFVEVLQVCKCHLEKNQVTEMLLSVDEFGDNVIHLLFENNPPEKFIEKLNHVKNTLADEELFKGLLKSKNGKLMNLVHIVAKNRNITNISFLDLYLSRNEIKELLIGKDEDGRTCLHWGANRHSKNLLALLEYSFVILKDYGSLFEELVLAENKNGNAFLHLFVGKYADNFREQYVIDVIQSVKEKVSDDVFGKLLSIRNKRGKTPLQIEGSRSKEVVECFERVSEQSLFPVFVKNNWGEF